MIRPFAARQIIFAGNPTPSRGCRTMNMLLIALTVIDRAGTLTRLCVTRRVTIAAGKSRVTVATGLGPARRGW